MIPSVGIPKIDAAIQALYQQVEGLEKRIGQSGVDAKENFEGTEGLVRIINTIDGGYALHARSKDGWITSTNVDFRFRDRTELAKKDDTPSQPAAHATSHWATGSDPIDITELDGYPASASVWLDGTGAWTDPGAGGGITSLGGQIGSTQTFSDVDDTNVTLLIESGSPAANNHRFTMGWTGTLAASRGGSGASSLTGLLQGNGASAFTAITNSDTVGQVLRVTGASTYAWGALDLSNASAITGTLGSSYLGSHTHVESDITDGTILARVASNETITGSWTFEFDAIDLLGEDAENAIRLRGPVEVADGPKTQYFQDASGTIALTSQLITDHGALSGLGDDDHSAIYPGLSQSETITGSWLFQHATYAFGDSSNDTEVTINRKGIVGGVITPPTVPYEAGLILKGTDTPTSGQAFNSPALEFQAQVWGHYGGAQPQTSKWQIFNWGFDTPGSAGGVLAFRVVRPELTITPVAFDEAGRVLLGHIKNYPYATTSYYGFYGEDLGYYGVILANDTVVGWPENELTKSLKVTGTLYFGVTGGGVSDSVSLYKQSSSPGWLKTNNVFDCGALMIDEVEVINSSKQWVGNDIPVSSGGTGASSLTGYVYGNGTSPMTASTTVPEGDISGTSIFARISGASQSITSDWTYKGSSGLQLGEATTALGYLKFWDDSDVFNVVMRSYTGGQDANITLYFPKQAWLGGGGQYIIATSDYTTFGSNSVWQGSTIGTGYGGTGLTSFTANGLVYASSTSALATSSNISTDGSKLTKYNNVVTDGFGVPAVVDYNSTGASAASFSGTAASNTTASGFYRISVYVRVYTIIGANASIIVDVNWKDDRGATTRSESTTSLSASSGLGVYRRLDLVVYHAGAGSTSITFDGNVSGGPDDLFETIWTVERLN